MDCFFHIAGLWLRVKGTLPCKAVEKEWGLFSIGSAYTVENGITDNTTIVCVNQKSVDYLVERYTLPSSMWQAFRYGSDVFFANRDFSLCVILPLSGKASFLVFSNQIFYTYAVQRHMIQLHASLIDDHGRGVIFLGPSGIGKTTQAERWMQYRGASILNGDMVFVQETQGPDKQYLGWGTPWHGSSPYCLNASVPVKALVVLKQAPQNALRELTGFEKVREVSGSVFYPTWLEDGMELCTDTLNHLLSDLPVYRLDNRADEEAVRLLAAEIDRIS